jgi:hypothetical protein
MPSFFFAEIIALSSPLFTNGQILGFLAQFMHIFDTLALSIHAEFSHFPTVFVYIRDAFRVLPGAFIPMIARLSGLRPSSR